MPGVVLLTIARFALSKTQQKWGDPAISMQKVNSEVIHL